MILPQPLAVVALLAVQSAALAVERNASNSSAIFKYTLPQHSADPAARAAALNVTRAGYTYGPPVAGGPYYPAGSLGTPRGEADLASLEADLEAEQALVEKDAEKATIAELAGKVSGSIHHCPEHSCLLYVLTGGARPN